MKIFPVIAAISLVGILGRGSKADSGSDALQGSLSFDEFMKSFNQSDFAAIDELSENGGHDVGLPDSSTTDLTSGLGSMEFESISDIQAFISNAVEEWSPTAVVFDWMEANSVDFKEFQKKMDEINTLMDKIKNLPGFESTAVLKPLYFGVIEKMEEVSAIVCDTVQKGLEKYGGAGSLTFEEAVAVVVNATVPSGSYSMASEENNEKQITETSAKTRSSPSFQKTWDKLTG